MNKSGLIFFDEPMKYYDVSIVQLEGSDLINQSLADLDFRNLQLTRYANEEFCESICLKAINLMGERADHSALFSVRLVKWIQIQIEH